MFRTQLIIAIDGPAASGKSTTARAAARELGYIYIDSGAMYRAATLAYLRQFSPDSISLPVNSEIISITFDDVERCLESCVIDLKPSEQGQQTFLNGENISQLIRLPEITARVSEVSALPRVRQAMVAQQRLIGEKGGIIMDGRDIGTVVFPQADLKLFFTASARTRAERRAEELRKQGIEVDMDEMEKLLLERDKYDSEREISPLKPAIDAIHIDTSIMTIQEQASEVVRLARKRAAELGILLPH